MDTTPAVESLEINRIGIDTHSGPLATQSADDIPQRETSLHEVVSGHEPPPAIVHNSGPPNRGQRCDGLPDCRIGIEIAVDLDRYQLSERGEVSSLAVGSL